MRFAFIAAEKATYPVRVLCRTLAVSRAGSTSPRSASSSGGFAPRLGVVELAETAGRADQGVDP